MLFLIWGVGAIVFFIIMLVMMAWEEGRGGHIIAEKEDLIISGLLFSGVWPLILIILAVISPFALFYHLIKKIASYTKSRSDNELRKVQ